MKLADDAVIAGLSPVVMLKLPGIERATLDIAGREAFILSGLDGRHGAHSLHTLGRALDLRSRDLAVPDVVRYALALADALGGQWDVAIETPSPAATLAELDRHPEARNARVAVLHNTAPHVHVEYAPL